MASKMPRRASGEALFIAPDQVGVVEVVARVHPDAAGEAAAYLDLAARIQEGDFDTVDLLAWSSMIDRHTSVAASRSRWPQ